MKQKSGGLRKNWIDTVLEIVHGNLLWCGGKVLEILRGNLLWCSGKVLEILRGNLLRCGGKVLEIVRGNLLWFVVWRQGAGDRSR